MRVGILGGGQLGRMLALAGLPLGLEFRFLEPSERPPAHWLGEIVQRRYGEIDAIDQLSDGMDVVTYEFENVNVEVARHIAERVPVYPPTAALELAQDRYVEKDGFRSLGVPTAPYRPVGSREELEAAVAALGLPAVLKTRRMGYDGKGQRVLREPADVEGAWEALGERRLILEAFIDFQRELSIIGVRGRDGETRFYPLVETEHHGGILRRATAPAPDGTPELQARAESYANKVLDAIDYVGVLAIELFQDGDDLIANEMAPRVHNSGHWSQDGAVCSQFENHVRAVCGLPLGDPSATEPTTMINLIGSVPDPADVLALPGAHLHLYGKTPREGRKVGHVNVVGDHPDTVAALRRMTGI